MLNYLVNVKYNNTEFLPIDVWFTDQNRKQPEIKDNVNTRLIIA